VFGFVAESVPGACLKKLSSWPYLPQFPSGLLLLQLLVALPPCADSLSAGYVKAYCIVPTKEDGSELDGRVVNVQHGPSVMEKFMHAHYPHFWTKIDKQIHPSKCAEPSCVSELVDALPGKSFAKMSKALLHDCHNELAQWFLDSDRCKNMKNDKGFRAFIQKIQVLPGLYELPSDEEFTRTYCRLGEKGRVRAQEWYGLCQAEGRKISIAGDIWTDGSMSILAIVGYVIRDGWVWSRCVLAVIDFSTVRHTGLEIKTKTDIALQSIGMKGGMHDECWRKVSDAGSNMKKGWRGFQGGDQTCCDHLIERTILAYSTVP